MANVARHTKSQRRNIGAVNTVSLLLIFLLGVAVVALGSLYLEQKHKNKLLLEQVAELKDSQILFMVPDEQAEVMANWMSNNPVMVQSFVERARKGELTTMPIGHGKMASPLNSVTTAPITIDDTRTEQPALRVSKTVQNSASVFTEIVSSQQDHKTRVLPVDSATSQPIVNIAATELLAHKPATDTLTADDAPIVNGAPKQPLDDGIESFPVKAQMLNVTDEGVKLISLPHGGIRITTRALED